MSPTDAIAKLRPPVFWKERDAVAAQARLWTAKKLNAAYDVLWIAELRSKTAGAPQELIAADAYRRRGEIGGELGALSPGADTDNDGGIASASTRAVSCNMIQKLTDKPISIAADHRGVVLKERLTGWMRSNGYSVKDFGTDSATERVDAMDYALRLAAEIKASRSDFAIGICGSGQMMAITANRFPFVRATLLHTEGESVGAREHGDANMLILGADVTDEATGEHILKTFLNTTALGDRYAARRERLAQLDISKL